LPIFDYAVECRLGTGKDLVHLETPRSSCRQAAALRGPRFLGWRTN
jgi:hypothetical protein